MSGLCSATLFMPLVHCLLEVHFIANFADAAIYGSLIERNSAGAISFQVEKYSV